MRKDQEYLSSGAEALSILCGSMSELKLRPPKKHLVQRGFRARAGLTFAILVLLGSGAVCARTASGVVPQDTSGAADKIGVAPQRFKALIGWFGFQSEPFEAQGKLKPCLSAGRFAMPGKLRPPKTQTPKTETPTIRTAAQENPVAAAAAKPAAARGKTALSMAGDQGGAATKPAPNRSQAAASDPALAAAEALVQRGLLSDAEARTRRFLDAHPESAEGHYLLGYILFAEIRQQYESEEKKEGASFRYNDSVSASLAATRDAKARASLAELSAGARYHSPNAFDLKIVALDYLLLKDNPAAEKWLGESVELNPGDAQAWFYLGRTQYSETKYAAAIEAFEHCLKVDPKNVEAEYNVGLSYEGLKQPDEALQAYQNAIAWQSGGAMKSADPFVAIGRLYLSRNQPDKAVPYLAQAVAAFPQISLAHEEMGKAYSILQRLPEAQAELEKAVELSPERASLRCVLGEVYTREHMAAKAKAEFARCSALQTAQTAGASPNAQPH